MQRFLSEFEEYVGSLMMLIMVAVVFVGVVARYVFQSPIIWVPEVATILFVWQVFLGVSIAMKRRMHIGVDVFTRLFPDSWQRWLKLGSDVLVVVFLAVFLMYALPFAIESANMKTSTFELPYTVVNLAVPVGFALMLVRMIPMLRNTERDHKEANR